MTDEQSAVSIGLMREVFCSEFTPQLFAGVDTHVPALRLVAQLVRHTDDDALLQAIKAPKMLVFDDKGAPIGVKIDDGAS